MFHCDGLLTNNLWRCRLGFITRGINLGVPASQTILFGSYSYMFCVSPAQLWWMNPCVWDRASISCAGEAARSSQELIKEALIMQTHGRCSPLIKRGVRMTRAVVTKVWLVILINVFWSRHVTAAAISVKCTCKVPTATTHNNELLTSQIKGVCLIVSYHSCVLQTSELVLLKMCATRPSDITEGNDSSHTVKHLC